MTWKHDYADRNLRMARQMLEQQSEINALRAERDRLRAAVERVRERARSAIRSADDYRREHGDFVSPEVDVDDLLRDLAALDQAPAAEPVKRTIEEALDIVDGQFAEDRTAEQDGGGR